MLERKTRQNKRPRWQKCEKEGEIKPFLFVEIPRWTLSWIWNRKYWNKCSWVSCLTRLRKGLECRRRDRRWKFADADSLPFFWVLLRILNFLFIYLSPGKKKSTNNKKIKINWSIMLHEHYCWHFGWLNTHTSKGRALFNSHGAMHFVNEQFLLTTWLYSFI